VIGRQTIVARWDRGERPKGAALDLREMRSRLKATGRSASIARFFPWAFLIRCNIRSGAAVPPDAVMIFLRSNYGCNVGHNLSRLELNQTFVYYVSMNTTSPQAPDGTRKALIAAGIRLFGRQGFSATSVRQLAQEAGANIAAIAYHFGGKDGLRLACAEEFGHRMTGAMAAVKVGQAESAVSAREDLRQIIRGMVSFLLGGPGSTEIVPFMLRELADDGPGIDAVYRGFAEPTHRRLCQLWAAATGAEAESDTVRLAVFALIGQIMYFRIGQSIVTRRMHWTTLGPAEIDLITQRILQNVDAMLISDQGA
jgi:AcrR family transcriptional regulator